MIYRSLRAMPPRGRYGLGDAASDAQDAATAQQQHALAVMAYNARQAGDWDTYTRAIQGLYALGFENVSQADLSAMIDIATTPNDPFAGLEKALFWGALFVGGAFFLQRAIRKGS